VGNRAVQQTDKTGQPLDETDAQKPWTLKAMLHASLIASVLTPWFVHKHHLATKPRAGRARDVGATSHMLVSRVIARRALAIARALLTKMTIKDELWEEMARRDRASRARPQLAKATVDSGPSPRLEGPAGQESPEEGLACHLTP